MTTGAISDSHPHSRWRRDLPRAEGAVKRPAMSTGTLTIDLDAIVANWRALAAMSQAETGAVVKADGYGLGAGRIARALQRAGATRFFVATAEEGASLRQEIGTAPEILVLSGHMSGDTDMIGDLGLTPVLNSIEQLTRHFEALPGAPFAIQLDTGMNRLGLKWADWAAVAAMALAQGPSLVMSQLACADEPDHPMNPRQLQTFREMTDGIAVPRSLAATGGILLGPDYHFEVTRPGIGLYGGLPFARAEPVVSLELPVIQIREVEPGESVGYACSFTATTPMRLATLAAGYADGLRRSLAGCAALWHGDTPCPMVGRVSMDLLTVDVTALTETPQSLMLLGPHQEADDLATVAGTVNYEILTQLGRRYTRRHVGA